MNNVAKNILVDNKIFVIRGLQVMVDRDLMKILCFSSQKMNLII